MQWFTIISHSQRALSIGREEDWYENLQKNWSEFQISTLNQSISHSSSGKIRSFRCPSSCSTHFTTCFAMNYGIQFFYPYRRYLSTPCNFPFSSPLGNAFFRTLFTSCLKTANWVRTSKSQLFDELDVRLMRNQLSYGIRVSLCQNLIKKSRQENYQIRWELEAMISVSSWYWLTVEEDRMIWNITLFPKINLVRDTRKLRDLGRG